MTIAYAHSLPGQPREYWESLERHLEEVARLASGFASAFNAEQWGGSGSVTNLVLFKQALNTMFENDRSSARGLMSPVRCVAFRHESKLGNARADQLFGRVQVKLRDELANDSRPPRPRDDYEISVNTIDLPPGITVEQWV